MKTLPNIPLILFEIYQQALESCFFRWVLLKAFVGIVYPCRHLRGYVTFCLYVIRPYKIRPFLALLNDNRLLKKIGFFSLVRKWKRKKLIDWYWYYLKWTISDPTSLLIGKMVAYCLDGLVLISCLIIWALTIMSSKVIVCLTCI